MRIAALTTLVIAMAGVFAACGTQGGAEGGDEWAIFAGAESGELEATLAINDRSGEDEGIRMRLIGTFLGDDEGSLPLVDMGAEAQGVLNGEEVDYSGALLVDSERAVVTHGGETYETDDDAFELLESSFEEALGSGGMGDLTACQRAMEGIDLGRLADNVRAEGRSTTLDGTPVSRVSADLDVVAAIDALVELTEDPGCGPQLEALAPVPLGELRQARSSFERGVKGARVVLAVDKDGILRELTANVILKPKSGEGVVEAEAVFRLNRVNEITELLPCTGERPLAALFEKLGFDPLKALEAGGGEALTRLLEGIDRGSLGTESS